MGMVVQHNMNALNAYNRLNANVAGLKKASEKLSSGYRINRAGDDAAGLAISEKMRSQIKGLNQATRNAQDGINMIQTFEGAAQETHSILQRMKELATESANGTYDNTTDRAAIQLEFDQLNDELNQIADTDYNGTIVLNGGQMADGLKVTADKTSDDGVIMNGEFNYGDFDTQKTAAKAELDKALAALVAPKDITVGTDAGWKTVGDVGFTSAEATSLWTKLGLDGTDADNVDVTFQFDGTKWTAVSAQAYKGVDTTDHDVTMPDAKKGDKVAVDGLDGKLKDAFTITDPAVDNAGNPATGKGGIEIKVAGGTNVIADLNFDNTKVNAGDVVTLNFANPGGKNMAALNVTFNDDSFDTLDGHFKFQNNPTFEAASTLLNLKDEDMSQEYQDLIDAINAKEFQLTATPNNTTKTNISLALKTANDKITVNGKDFNIAIANDKLTITAAAALGPIKANDVVLSINLGKVDQENSYTAGGTTAEDTSFKLKISTSSVKDPAKKPDVSWTKTDEKILTEGDVAKANAAKAKELQEAFDKRWGEGDTVSKANSFEKSKGRLTYANNITLQTGARTKDSVNFTFKYDTDSSGDMGELERNLNLSSRSDGLKTADLSLANAEDSNYAIDQIDKAINKTSMVRATFGSIQNRLEHKITNLTTTQENLTEAESSIRDTDMASEMMNYTKFNILQQAAQSMLAQANQQPQSVLQLLG